MKTYISYSEFYLWSTDINEYFHRYILGIKIKPSKAMTFGTLVHGALSGEIPDLTQALLKHYFTPDWIDVGNKLLTAPRADKREIGLYMTGSRDTSLKPDVVAIFDGYNPQGYEIVEYKTTKNGWRSQEDVDSNKQITMYCMVHYFLTGVMPNFTLYRLDSGNGRIKKYTTTRTVGQCRTMIDELNTMYDDLVAKGWWSMRKGGGKRVAGYRKNATEFVTAANTVTYALQSSIR